MVLAMGSNNHWENDAKNSGSSTPTKQSKCKVYAEYPSKESSLVRQGMACGEKYWKGYFEDLLLYCGIDFDRSRMLAGQWLL